ncbi:MAG: 23S rRNA (guanosine(2251)-2'-O)-methyltransferase RlmB [Firmicutes bacterium]|nr:23S rRNA (guanosine(2251)-2'-O)-methyltransferase RlmB [Bacillota bacterium]
MPDNLLIGRNPVTEALKSGRGIDRLLMVKGAEGSAIKIEGMAREKRIEIQYVRRSALDRITDGAAHQGVAAYVSDYQYAEVEDILAKAGEKGEAPFLVLLDGIEDPHNLGAIIRTADAAGAHGIVIPKRRAVAVTPTVEKAAAGAAEYASIARVTNIGRTIEELKEKGIWTAAADMSGASVWESDLSGPIAIVIGNEGHGISRLVREKCDFTVSLPMLGNINSLNASNAAALLMYEVVRQRTQRN